MGLEKDLPVCDQHFSVFRPFRDHLAASDRWPKTIQKDFGNVWVLGGESIRNLNNDSSRTEKPMDLLLRRTVEYSGPLR